MTSIDSCLFDYIIYVYCEFYILRKCMMMHMISRYILFLAALGCGVQGALAQPGIRDTKHNLSLTGPGPIKSTSSTGICEFCHTPHGADTSQITPLWTSDAKQATYQVYTSPTLDATAAGGPTGTSLACLSCHDGTMAFDVLRTLSTSNGVTSTSSTDETFHADDSGDSTTSSTTSLSTDLRNDHPISIRYEDARSPSATDQEGTAGFRPVVVDGEKKCVARSGITSCSDPEALPLASATPEGPADYVQCTSCHDPHQEPDKPTFLRKPNTGSALCLTCHVKDG